MSLPAGIFSATTTPPEPNPGPAPAEGQGGADRPVARADQGDDAPAEPKASRARRKKATAATGADTSDDGAKLYLTPDVRFRLRMLAYSRGKKISAVANEVLDRALPRWNLERTE
jgi:hypothetical protein